MRKSHFSSNVSVILVNWNREQFLERCMAALMAQTVTPNEIILVDKACSDGSAEIARQFPSWRLAALDESTGFSRGNNLAIEAGYRKTNTERIALINPYAFVESRWLEALLVAAESNCGFDVFGSKLINAAYPTVLDGAGDAHHVSGPVWCVGHGTPGQNECEVFSPSAAAALYRRSALREFRGFDENYFCCVEDVDLGFRLLLRDIVVARCCSLWCIVSAQVRLMVRIVTSPGIVGATFWYYQ